MFRRRARANFGGLSVSSPGRYLRAWGKYSKRVSVPPFLLIAGGCTGQRESAASALRDRAKWVVAVAAVRVYTRSMGFLPLLPRACICAYTYGARDFRMIPFPRDTNGIGTTQCSSRGSKLCIDLLWVCEYGAEEKNKPANCRERPFLPSEKTRARAMWPRH